MTARTATAEEAGAPRGAMLRLAAFEPRSLANGPGVRAVVWVQGCGRRCPGCFNESFQPLDGGREVTAEEVARWIATEGAGIEGVTFSGGEPFDQAGALAHVARAAHARGLGVLVFTGYPWVELRGGAGPGWRDLLDASDLLVAGPYEKGNPGPHPLLASDNQEFVHLTDRYRRALGGMRRTVELHIGADGNVRMTGFPPAEMLAGGVDGTR